jgi:hypothetical protein
MPSTDTLERFIACVEANRHDEAIAEFYLEDGSIQENQSPPRVGRDALIAGERRTMSRAARIASTCVRPVFVAGDHAVVRWIFRFEWHDGTVTEMEEVAMQRWSGERIASEQFFYDPAQRVPKPR